MNLSDELLVAYLDGELSITKSADTADALAHDHNARARLTRLKRGDRPFAEAFDTLLDAAPGDELQAMFAELVAQTSGSRIRRKAPGAKPSGETVIPFRHHPQPRPEPVRRTPLWQMAAAAAVLAAVFTGGLFTGGMFNEPQTKQNALQPRQVAGKAPGWREAAARYVALFSKETLNGMPQDIVERRTNLALAERALGLPLSRDRLVDPRLDFRGTQLLNFNGKPLAQIAYLHGGEKPVALCIIATNKDPAQPENETRQGLNIVHWVKGGYGFMVIGDVPEDELNRIAARFRSQFS